MIITRKIALYPILVISLAASFQFYKYVLQVYPSIITQPLMSEFHLTGAGLGNLAASFYYSFIITQLLVGFLLDRFGTRWVTALAILACANGVFFFSYSHTAFSACIFRALIGMGVAFSTVAYMKIAAEWSSEKYYPLVTGLLATATMLGAVFGELPLAYVMSKLGWRTSLAAVGISGILLAMLFALLVRPNSFHTKEKNSLTLNDLLTVIKNKQNWLLTLYGGLAFSPISIFAGLWGNPFLQQAYHLSKTQSATMISLIFLGLGIGSPIIGIIAGKTENKLQLMFYSTLIAFASLSIVLFYQPPTFLLGSLLFMYGFALGAYLLAFTVGKEMNKVSVIATVIAMINAGDALFTGITEPLIGKILDLSWNGQLIDGVRHFSRANYQKALVILPIYLLSGAIVIYGLNYMQKRAAIKLKRQAYLHAPDSEVLIKGLSDSAA